MLHDKILNIKSELRHLPKGGLLKMVFGQPEKNCILGGTCPFLLNYHKILFCVSEVLGQGCQHETGRASPSNESLDLTGWLCLPGLVPYNRQQMQP